MLGKLLKYDLKWCFKPLLVFYMLAIFFSIIVRIVESFEQSLIILIIDKVCCGIVIAMLVNILINCFMRNWARFVKNIYKDFIIVKMITNNDFIIQGFGKNELGILKYDDNKLIFSSNENLNINDEIYISNLTGYNEKIVLGTIKGIIYTPEKVYEIKPVDINKIDYLVVLSRNKQ